MRALFKLVRDSLSRDYDIRRVVGAGGMATVFEAWAPQRSHSVAIKVLKPELSEGVPRERFRREVAVASKLDHPNIVPILESGERNGVVYYVMPFVPGETLRNRLTREKNVPLSEAIYIATQIAAALEHAHENGIMHRDIKPENILLTEGIALVTDFGIARAILDDGASLTLTGSAVGTPNYMSPEQATGGVSDERTDIYSLGCVLYEMIVGTRPFADLRSPFARNPDEPAPRAGSRTGRSVPPMVDDLLVKSLSWNPDERQGSARELREALEAAQAITGPPATPATGRGALRGWAILGIGAAVVLGAGILASRLVNPIVTDPTLVAVVSTVEGAAGQRNLINSLMHDMTRSLDRRVGIEVVHDGSTGTSRYVVRWHVQRDAQDSTTARIRAELVPTSARAAVWEVISERVPMTAQSMSDAAADIVRSVAAEIRARRRSKP